MSRSVVGAIAIGCIGFCMTHSVANAAVADFDTLSEGAHGLELVDGGIHFFDTDWYIPGDPPPLIVIDQADGNLGDDPFFSSPNGMGLGGFSPGPIGGGSRFGSISFELEGGGLSNAASVDLWFNQLDPTNSVTLAAYFGDQMVGSTSVDGPINCCDMHVRLTLSGFTFDSLRLFGAGQQNDGAAFMLVDNVRIRACRSTSCSSSPRIDAVPLPAGLWLLASGCMLLPRLRSRRSA